MHKIFLSSCFTFAFIFGVACTNPERESCESFKESRDGCEAANGEYEPVIYELCNNVDSECKEFYDCVVALECVDLGTRMTLGGFEVDEDGNVTDKLVGYRTLCPQPEDKECTDDDLRVLKEVEEPEAE